MMDFAALATAAVSLLTSLLHKGVEKGVEKVGESSAGALYEALKRKLTHAGTREALADLKEKPDEADRQAALRVQLGKALQAHPELAARVIEWIGQAQPSASVQQVATAMGSASVVQICGSNNNVHGRR